MTRFIFPILLIVAAIGLFATYTNPGYQATKSLAAQASSYDDALNKAQELRARRDELLSKYNTFSTEDRQRLLRGLPDNVDNIRLIIDINNIAARHALALKNVSLGDVSDSRTSRNALSVGVSGDAVGSVSVSFTLAARYEDFLAFLQDLEHSLRLVEVESISFTAPTSENGGVSDYSVSIRTYWLR
jgi:Tfp pilus assembly protein PilO